MIVGASGSGKSTLSKKLSKEYDATYIDIDKIWPEVNKQYMKIHNIEPNTKTEDIDASVQEHMDDWCRKKILEICSKIKRSGSKDNKIIIDGMDLVLDPFTPEWACTCAMIILRPSILKSLIRRFKRNPKKVITNFPRFFKYTLSKQRFDFDKLLDGYIKKRIQCSKEVKEIEGDI